MVRVTVKEYVAALAKVAVNTPEVLTAAPGGRLPALASCHVTPVVTIDP
jgi:hypothetical protein